MKVLYLQSTFLSSYGQDSRLYRQLQEGPGVRHQEVRQHHCRRDCQHHAMARHEPYNLLRAELKKEIVLFS